MFSKARHLQKLAPCFADKLTGPWRRGRRIILVFVTKPNENMFYGSTIFVIAHLKTHCSHHVSHRAKKVVCTQLRHRSSRNATVSTASHRSVKVLGRPLFDTEFISTIR